MGGIFVAQQAEELVKQGCSIQVVSPLPWVPKLFARFNPRWSKLRTVPLQAKLNGIQVYYPRVPVFPKRIAYFLVPYLYCFFLRKLITLLFKEFGFSLIHAHTALPDGYAGMLIAKKLNLPLIVTIHGYDLDPNNTKHLVWRSMLKTVLNTADRVVFVSSYLSKLAAVGFGTMVGKTRIVYNGITLPLSTVQVVPKLNERLVILAVGNLIPRKGINILLKAFNLLKPDFSQAVLRIVGAGQERENLEELANKLELETKVSFLGRLPYQQVMEEMSRCHIFCLPSWHEGFGLVYLEAMARGKPVIGCRGQGIEDGIVDGINGFLVAKQDINGLALCLNSLLLDSGLRQEVGRIAKMTVREKFTLKQEADELNSLYLEVLNNKMGDLGR